MSKIFIFSDKNLRFFFSHKNYTNLGNLNIITKFWALLKIIDSEMLQKWKTLKNKSHIT